MGFIIQFVTGFYIGLTGAMMPGPLLVFTVSRTMKGNLLTPIKIIFGHIVVEVIILALILVWLERIQNLEIIRIVISLIGGSAMAVLGVLMAAKASQYSLPKGVDEEHTSTSAKGDISGGAFFSAFNAGFPLWWLTVGAVMVLAARRLGPVGVVLFMAGHWLSDVGWYAIVGFGVVKGRSVLSDSVYRAMLRVLGAGLACFGAYCIVKAFLSGA